MRRRTSRSTLFPYTTLFRSRDGDDRQGEVAGESIADDPESQVRDGLHQGFPGAAGTLDRKSTRLNSSHRCISYAVFCLKKKKTWKSSRRTSRTWTPSQRGGF